MFKNQLEKTGENYYYLKTIVNNKADLVKLDIIESIGKLIALLAVGLVLLVFFSLALIASFIAFSIYMNQILDSSFLGILVSAALISLAGLVIYAMRHKLIIDPLSDIIYRKLYDDHE